MDSAAAEVGGFVSVGVVVVERTVGFSLFVVPGRLLHQVGELVAHGCSVYRVS